MGEPNARVKTVEELPDESLRCAAAGRHIGFFLNDPTMRPISGWGRLNAWEVRWRCDCSRWKTEVIDRDTGETLSRSAQYGGGVLLEIPEDHATGGLNQRQAKRAWLDRCAARGGRG